MGLCQQLIMIDQQLAHVPEAGMHKGLEFESIETSKSLTRRLGLETASTETALMAWRQSRWLVISEMLWPIAITVFVRIQVQASTQTSTCQTWKVSLCKSKCLWERTGIRKLQSGLALLQNGCSAKTPCLKEQQLSQCFSARGWKYLKYVQVVFLLNISKHSSAIIHFVQRNHRLADFKINLYS